MNVLVLGGTRFFGRRLVDQLLKDGHKTTIISTRDLDVEYFGKVKLHKADRNSKRELANALSNKSFDVVFDQICYAPNSAQLLLERTAGKVGKYILTSTQSVYVKSGAAVEADFDPTVETIVPGDLADFPFPERYGEGKRMSEAVYFQKAQSPVAALRIPIVFGPDDYTLRLKKFVKNIVDGSPILVPNVEARFSLVHANDVVKALLFLATTTVVGPLNVACTETMSVGELAALVESVKHKKANLVTSGDDDIHNPFAGAESKFLDVTKASGLGFKTSLLNDWLPALI